MQWPDIAVETRQLRIAIVSGRLLPLLVLHMTMQCLSALFQEMKGGTVPGWNAMLRHSVRITQIVIFAGNVVLLDQFHFPLDTYHLLNADDGLH